MAHQMHYTCLPKQTTGRAGFQFTARSTGTPPDAERVIARFMTYRPPAGGGPADQCPVSLAYEQTCKGPVVICCRYLGEDYTGRPGNFLGHAILAAPQELENLRPIELWRAPFWADEPASALSTLDPVTAGQTIDPERVCGLLAGLGDPGSHMLAGLLDATRDTMAGQAGPVSLVSEDVDLIALWIAAVSYSLPIALARDLSFITYTADPRLARHHLVGTTPQAWSTGHGEGAAFHLDTPHVPAGQPTPYAAAVATAWRAGDLEKIDTLCAVACHAVRVIPGGTARDGGLDAAAGLLSLCQGDPVPDRGHDPAWRVLESLPTHDRDRLLHRTAVSLANADHRTLHALITGDGGGRLADLLVDRDWSASPQVARLVYTHHGRRHRDRRGEMAERLLDLGVGSEDVGDAIAALWTDTAPTAFECVSLLERLDRSAPAAADHPAVRDLVARVLAAPNPTAALAIRLARASTPRYPVGTSEPWPYDSPFSTPCQLADPDCAANDPARLAAGARMLLATMGIATGCAEGRPPRHLARAMDRLAWWHPCAEPAVARRAVRHAVSQLTGMTVTDQADLLRNAAEQTRHLLIGEWLALAPDAPHVRVDLAELALRLRGHQVEVRRLNEYVTALARRPLGFRRIHRVLQDRDRSLADELRTLVTETGGGWRAVFRRPVRDRP